MVDAETASFLFERFQLDELLCEEWPSVRAVVKRARFLRRLLEKCIELALGDRFAVDAHDYAVVLRRGRRGRRHLTGCHRERRRRSRRKVRTHRGEDERRRKHHDKDDDRDYGIFSHAVLLPQISDLRSQIPDPR